MRRRHRQEAEAGAAPGGRSRRPGRRRPSGHGATARVAAGAAVVVVLLLVALHIDDSTASLDAAAPIPPAPPTTVARLGPTVAVQFRPGVRHAVARSALRACARPPTVVRTGALLDRSRPLGPGDAAAWHVELHLGVRPPAGAVVRLRRCLLRTGRVAGLTLPGTHRPARSHHRRLATTPSAGPAGGAAAPAGSSAAPAGSSAAPAGG